jgi:hypothetical protein
MARNQPEFARPSLALTRLALVKGILLTLAAFVPVQVSADETNVTKSDNGFDRGCADNDGAERCDKDIQRDMLDLYTWESAKALADGGVQFRRFMMVDGYGRDVIGITFERWPGSSPQVSVDVPRSKIAGGELEGPPPTPLVATLGQDAWRRTPAVTERFDQKLAREIEGNESNDENVLTICLHGWFTVVEAGDPARPPAAIIAPPELRSDAEGSCAKGLAMPAAFELAQIAFGSLEECHGLILSNFRNLIALLAYCNRLGGDRLAAAEAAKMINGFDDHLSQSEGAALTCFFSWEDRGAADEFGRQLRGASAPYWGAPCASDQHHVIVLGTMHLRDQPPDEGNACRFADIRLELKGDSAG